MCETVLADNLIILCHCKVNVRKVSGCGVEHLDVLVVQLLHTNKVLSIREKKK